MCIGAVVWLGILLIMILWVAVDEVRKHRRRQREREALKKFLQK